MKSVLTLLIVAALGLTAARAQEINTMVVQNVYPVMVDPESAEEMTFDTLETRYYFTPLKLRKEVSGIDFPNAMDLSLIDMENGLMITASTSSKKFFKAELEPERLEMMLVNSLPEIIVNVAPTGEQRDISGYRTEEVVVDVFDSLRDDFTNYRIWITHDERLVTEAMYKRIDFLSQNIVGEIRKLKGFPLLVEATVPQSEQRRLVEISEVGHAEIKPDMFEVPADFEPYTME